MLCRRRRCPRGNDVVVRVAQPADDLGNLLSRILLGNSDDDAMKVTPKKGGHILQLMIKSIRKSIKEIRA